MARCVGYAKSRGGRCAVELEPGSELWQDATTGAAGGAVNGPPRCHYHPPGSDPEGWALPAGEGGGSPDPGEGPASDPTPPDPAPDPAPAGPVAPAPGPVEADPEPEEPDAALFAGLEPAPDATVDPSVTGTERPERAPGLEDTVRDILGDELDEEGELEASAPDLEPGPGVGPSPTGSAGPDPARVKGWQRRARSILEGPVNGKLRRDGVAPLEADELEVGSEVVGEALAEILAKVDPNNPYGAVALWVILTFPPRYIGRGVSERRAASSGEGAPDADPAPAGPEPDNASSRPAADTSRPGWASELELVGEE